MVVEGRLLLLVCLVACGGPTTTKADVFEGDFEEGDEVRGVADADDLAAAVDIEASVDLEYDLPYKVYLDGDYVGTARRWRTRSKAKGEPIITGVEVVLPGAPTGGTLTIHEERHYDAEWPHAMDQVFLDGRDVTSLLPENANVTVLGEGAWVLFEDQVERGMWHKTRNFDVAAKSVVSETTVVRKLGWAEYNSERVRVLWLDVRMSDGRRGSSILLSNGVTAYWERDGMEMRLEGSGLHQQ